MGQIYEMKYYNLEIQMKPMKLLLWTILGNKTW